MENFWEKRNCLFISIFIPTSYAHNFLILHKISMVQPMVDREKIISPDRYAREYQRKFGTLPLPLGSYDWMELHELDIPLLHLQRFLHTGRFNSMFDEYLRDWDITFVGFLQDQTRHELFTNFHRLQINPDVLMLRQHFVTKKGQEADALVAAGKYLPSVQRIPEIIGIVAEPGKIERIEMRLLHPGNAPPLLDFLSKRKEKHKTRRFLKL
jgi:hypothetical protein